MLLGPKNNQREPDMRGIIKQMVIICTGILLVLSFLVGHAKSAQEKQITLRLAHEGSTTSSRQMTGLKLVELTDKYTGGRLKIGLCPKVT